MARIAPLDPPFDTEVADQLARMMPPGVEPIALFRLFVRNLPMAQAMSGWGTYELSRRLSLTLLDRAAGQDPDPGRRRAVRSPRPRRRSVAAARPAPR
jgi:hypothetical protein